MMTPDQIAEKAEEWILRIEREHRAHWEPRRVLTTEERNTLHQFFPSTVLERVLICDVSQDWIPTPPLADWGLYPDWLTPEGLARTYHDTIFSTPAAQKSTAPPFGAILFHELVHVVQYERLGVRGFSRLYYHGIVSMGGHTAAYPLEAMAYLLQGWFQAKPTAPFFVPGEVERALAHLR
jgi:hypothetical protein